MKKTLLTLYELERYKESKKVSVTAPRDQWKRQIKHTTQQFARKFYTRLTKIYTPLLQSYDKNMIQSLLTWFHTFLPKILQMFLHYQSHENLHTWASGVRSLWHFYTALHCFSLGKPYKSDNSEIHV